MKNKYATLFSAFLLIASVYSTSIQAQGLIVNELSNGAAGSQEYIEFVVVGSQMQKTGFVNLKGWILDDNGGGALSPTGGSRGIASGHYRLGQCFENIPIGAIIVIYNAREPYGGLPADDPNDSNEDMVYVLPSNHSCLEICTEFPTSTNSNYGLPNCGTSGYKSSTEASWESLLALSNSTDGFQTRMPDGTLYHALGYGLSSYTAASIHIDLGGGNAINNMSGGSGNTYIYSCGVLSNSNNFQRVGHATGSPGAVNNVDNENLIDNIRIGEFDYTNWGNPLNCERTMPLPLHLTNFGVSPKAMQNNELNWTLVTVDPYSFVEIQRSKDGIQFESIATLELEATMEERHYQYMDYTPYLTTYYRLKFTEPNAPMSYSDIRVVTHQKWNEQNVTIYPNPTQGDITLTFSESLDEHIQYEIIDILGRVLVKGDMALYQNNIQISTVDLAKGNYYLRLSGDKIQMTRKFIKN